MMRITSSIFMLLAILVIDMSSDQTFVANAYDKDENRSLRGEAESGDRSLERDIGNSRLKEIKSPEGNSGPCPKPWKADEELVASDFRDCQFKCYKVLACGAFEWKRNCDVAYCENCELFYYGNIPTTAEGNGNYECWKRDFN